MRDFNNITMGIQISPKREKLLNPQTVALEETWPEYYGIVEYYDRDEYLGGLGQKEEYLELVRNTSRYLSVRGMFEIKDVDGFNFKV